VKSAFALWFALCLGTVAACGGGGGGGGGAQPDATGGGGDGGAIDDSNPSRPQGCGDGVLAAGEACDDGNVDGNDGCSADCTTIEPGWVCGDPGSRCIHAQVCGDGFLETGETCDDRNTTPGDGCSASCQLEAGWACAVPGIRCTAAACGDGIVAGFEECDDHNTDDADGCSHLCVVEEGYACTSPGGACVPVVCGNGVREGSEQCDDGNNDLGDGCDPQCHREPVCTDGTCTRVCGDGVIQPGEACDDGNVRDFDGCAHDCTVETGFACTPKLGGDADTFAVSIVYRDFMGFDIQSSYPSGPVIGHIDFEDVNKQEKRIVGRAINDTTQTTPPTPLPPIGTLGSDHKPQYALGVADPTNQSTHGKAAFDQWYRDVPAVGQTPAVNVTIAEKLVLNPLVVNMVRVPGAYVYDNQAFFPLDGRGFTAPGGPEVAKTARPDNHNFSFTSELRYWFTYKENENLSFIGDDDVWVFINNRLAVDLGGVHGALSGSVTLDTTAAASNMLDLHIGGTYEVAVFQAERHTSKSTYKLTLAGFDAVRSDCQSVCGDGITASDEVCDDGVNDGSYNSCAPGCKAFGPRCGDGHIDAGHEACDDGLNTGAYNTCTATCELAPRCGDGIVQAAHGEACDDGNTDPNDGCDQCQFVLQ